MSRDPRNIFQGEQVLNSAPFFTEDAGWKAGKSARIGVGGVAEGIPDEVVVKRREEVQRRIQGAIVIAASQVLSEPIQYLHAGTLTATNTLDVVNGTE